ncbi:MAG: cupin domain-containing protein [Acidobacteriota bacterium]
MRLIVLSTAIAVAAGVLIAQGGGQQRGGGKGPAAPKLYTSAAEVQALIAKAKEQNAAKSTATIAQNLLRLDPYNVSMEYRSSIGPAAIHDTEAEMFYVIDGTATMVTGGKLVGETRNGVNLTGSAIEGGDTRNIGKGDFIVVPEKTAHWFSQINGTLVLMSFHLTRPVPAAAK